MDSNDIPESISLETAGETYRSEAEPIDRRATLARVAKYSAPLIAALLPDKAKAFSF